MQGRKSSPEESLFIYHDPYRELPRSRFYEALEKHLDLEWVREATRGLYAEGVGRPSLDPVVFVKLMLVSYFENIETDSELAFRSADSLTIRRFLGYGLGESTPERTTVLKTRQRWPEEMFAAIFMGVLEQLAGEGLVKGEHLGTDTVLIDANAAMDSLRHREFGVSYEEFVRALYSREGREISASEVARKDEHRPRKGSNAEWVSATDPEAAVAVHPDGHTGLSYRLDAVVDLDTGAVVQIGAEPGNVRDSVDLPQRMEEAKANLEQVGLTPTDVTADRGHHSQENVIELEAMGVAPIIRALVLPGSIALSEKEVEQIKAFVKRGGLLLADEMPGQTDVHGKRLPEASLAEVFAGERYGRGRAVLLRRWLDEYDNQRLRSFGEEVREQVRAALETSRIKPRVDVNAGGTYPVAVERVSWSGGQIEALALLKEPAGRFGESSDGTSVYEPVAGMKQTERVRVRLPKEGHWYDLRAHAYLGVRDEIRTTLKEAEPKIYAMLPYKVGGLSLSVTGGRAPGRALSYQAKVTAGRARPVGHALKVEVFGPDGEKRHLYSGNIDAPAGSAKGAFRLALNDAKGTWRIALTDVFSGETAEKTWTVR